jgi:phosphatidate cytidylyltransferase
LKNSLVLRTITGVIFVVAIVCGIIINPLSFASLFSIITALTIFEFCSLINSKYDLHVNRVINMAAGVFLFLAFSGFCSNVESSRVFLPYILLIIYMMISELYLKHPHPLLNWAYSMMSQLYIALPFAMLNILYFQKGQNDIITINAILPLAVFVFLWLNDTGAYCFGTLLGKHRLFERISPKKSWEGSIGGGLITIIVSILVAHYFDFMNVYQWMGLALVVIVFGTWGDLTESLIKRQLEIKDSGNILPGHGGMLDRFDSSLMAIPAAVCYLYFIS